mmetsp:Transcript_63434/g.138128  ORF Transcript_63434/g.138128 Transcript_63434/m.138128 type:complete len:209 (-) Transcript_63434:59-685(-)
MKMGLHESFKSRFPRMLLHERPRFFDAVIHEFQMEVVLLSSDSNPSWTLPALMNCGIDSTSLPSACMAAASAPSRHARRGHDLQSDSDNTGCRCNDDAASVLAVLVGDSSVNCNNSKLPVQLAVLAVRSESHEASLLACAFGEPRSSITSSDIFRSLTGVVEGSASGGWSSSGRPQELSLEFCLLLKGSPFLLDVNFFCPESIEMYLS